MKHEHISKLSDQQFRRVTGVKRPTFKKMVEIVTLEYKKKHKKGGRPHTLTREEMVLITLEYLREYRTYVNIGASYGLSESNAFQTIRWVETVLIESKEFSLPGKKALYKDDVEYEVILVDATESPIERPQKNKKSTTRVKRNGIR